MAVPWLTTHWCKVATTTRRLMPWARCRACSTTLRIRRGRTSCPFQSKVTEDKEDQAMVALQSGSSMLRHSISSSTWQSTTPVCQCQRIRAVFCRILLTYLKVSTGLSQMITHRIMLCWCPASEPTTPESWTREWVTTVREQRVTIRLAASWNWVRIRARTSWRVSTRTRATSTCRCCDKPSRIYQM